MHSEQMTQFLPIGGSLRVMTLLMQCWGLQYLALTSHLRHWTIGTALTDYTPLPVSSRKRLHLWTVTGRDTQAC